MNPTKPDFKQIAENWILQRGLTDLLSTGGTKECLIYLLEAMYDQGLSTCLSDMQCVITTQGK